MFSSTLQERITEAKRYEDDLFLVHLPDNLKVLIRPLSYNLFRRYKYLLEERLLTEAEVENAIFKQCVLNEDLTECYPEAMDAGIVTTVVREVLKISTPQSLEETEALVSHFMGEYFEDLYEIMLRVITSAYPTYLPTELDKMSWISIIKLFSRAQVLLLERGLIKEPIRLKKEEKKQPKRPIFGSTVPGTAPSTELRPPPTPDSPPDKTRLPPSSKRLPYEVKQKLDRMKERVLEANKPSQEKKKKKIVMKSGKTKEALAQETPPAKPIVNPEASLANLPPEAFHFPGFDLERENRGIMEHATSNWDIAEGPARLIREQQELEELAHNIYPDLFAKKKPPAKPSKP